MTPMPPDKEKPLNGHLPEFSGIVSLFFITQPNFAVWLPKTTNYDVVDNKRYDVTKEFFAFLVYFDTASTIVWESMKGIFFEKENVRKSKPQCWWITIRNL